MDLNEQLKGWLQQQAQPGSFLDKAGLGLAQAGQTLSQDAAAGASIMNDPRNSWIGMNPVGKMAAGGLGMAGMMLGQVGKHELPAVGLNLGKQVESQAAKNYKNWFEQVGIRAQQEVEGQGILDDLDEMGRSPKQVVADFWERAYPQLPPEAQERFHKMIKNQTGMKPGGVLYVDKDGTQITAKGWHEVYDPDIAPSAAEDLEGTERGLIALMEMANQRFPKQAGTGLGLEDGKTINVVPRGTP